MRIYYENSAGKCIELSTWPIMIQEPETLFGHQWAYETTEGSKMASITGFNMGVVEKEATLSVFADSAEEFRSALDNLHEITEYDIQRLAAGKLYINDQYMSCYCFGIGFQEFDEDFETTDIEIFIATEYPFWCRDINTVYRKKEEPESGETYLDYPRNYLYNYKRSDATTGLLLNDHYTACGFRMTVQGSCVEPAITIDDHLYEVKTKVSDGEYMLIDSRTKTVKKYDKYGNEFDVFNSRNKESELFQKIPGGGNLVRWSGEFSFEITLFYERSEPKWTL